MEDLEHIGMRSRRTPNFGTFDEQGEAIPPDHGWLGRGRSPPPRCAYLNFLSASADLTSGKKTLSQHPHVVFSFSPLQKPVGARHPRPPTRHREAERRDPQPRPAARVRARPSGRGWGRAVAAGAARPASCVGCAPRRACERRAAAASRQVALAAAKFARLWILDWTLVS